MGENFTKDAVTHPELKTSKEEIGLTSSQPLLRCKENFLAANYYNEMWCIGVAILSLKSCKNSIDSHPLECFSVIFSEGEEVDEMTCLDFFFENFPFYSSSPFTSQLRRQASTLTTIQRNITFAHLST